MAGAYSSTEWWPSEPHMQAEIMQWLSTASNEVQNGPGAARLVDLFGYKIDKNDTLSRSERILSLIDEHLAKRDWLALSRPTVADCAVFPYVALAPDGGIDLTQYKNIVRWIDRIKGLPGFVTMPGI